MRAFEQESFKELKALLGKLSVSREEEDEQIWIGDSSGVFSLKTTVNLALQEPLKRKILSRVALN